MPGWSLSEVSIKLVPDSMRRAVPPPLRLAAARPLCKPAHFPTTWGRPACRCPPREALGVPQTAQRVLEPTVSRHSAAWATGGACRTFPAAAAYLSAGLSASAIIQSSGNCVRLSVCFCRTWLADGMRWTLLAAMLPLLAHTKLLPSTQCGPPAPRRFPLRNHLPLAALPIVAA